MKMSQESGHEDYLAWSLQGFGEIALSRQQWHEAQQYFVESLALFGKRALKQCLIRSLMGLAGVAEGQQRPERAVQLVGAMEALLGMGGRPYWEALFVQTEYERLVTALRNTLGEEVFATEVAKGREMTLEQAIAYGMDN